MKGIIVKDIVIKETGLKIFTAVIAGAVAKVLAEMDEESVQQLVKQWCQGGVKTEEQEASEANLNDEVLRVIRDNPEELKAFLKEHM